MKMSSTVTTIVGIMLSLLSIFCVLDISVTIQKTLTDLKESTDLLEKNNKEIETRLNNISSELTKRGLK
jgi:biopolymer transport protein ExbD